MTAGFVSHHNLNISDTFFCYLQLVVWVQAENLGHLKLNLGGKGGWSGSRSDTLVVGWYKISFREQEEVDWLLLTWKINRFYDGHSIVAGDWEGRDNVNGECRPPIDCWQVEEQSHHPRWEGFNWIWSRRAWNMHDPSPGVFFDTVNTVIFSPELSLMTSQFYPISKNVCDISKFDIHVSYQFITINIQLY